MKTEIDENKRVNRRVMNLLQHRVEGVSDAEILRWGRELEFELTCQNANYQYLLMDCGEWIVEDEQYLRSRWTDIHDGLFEEAGVDDAEDVSIDVILEALSDSQDDTTVFVMKSESDVYFVDII